MLDTKLDGYILQIMILMKNGEHEIRLEDADVRLIVGSIMLSE